MTDWFRSWHGAPTDNKWLVIGKRAGVAPGVVSAIWWAMLDHASQSLARGDVSNFDVETYAAFSGFEPKSIEDVLRALTEKGLILNGILIAWSKRQASKEDVTAANRKRAQRERDKSGGHAASRSVTPRHALSRDVTLEKSRVEERREEKRRVEKKEEETRVEVRAEARRHPKGTRWPSEAVVSQEWQTEAAMRRAEHGLVDVDISLESERFCNYWASKSGVSSTKVDWHKTWLNWALKADGVRNGKGNGHGNGPGDKLRRTVANAHAVLAQLEGGEPSGNSSSIAEARGGHGNGGSGSAAANLLRGTARERDH